MLAGTRIRMILFSFKREITSFVICPRKTKYRCLILIKTQASTFTFDIWNDDVICNFNRFFRVTIMFWVCTQRKWRRKLYSFFLFTLYSWNTAISFTTVDQLDWEKISWQRNYESSCNCPFIWWTCQGNIFWTTPGQGMAWSLVQFRWCLIQIQYQWFRNVVFFFACNDQLKIISLIPPLHPRGWVI